MSRHDLIVVKRLELLNMKLCPHENMKLNASLGGLFEAGTSYPHTAKCDERCLNLGQESSRLQRMPRGSRPRGEA